MPCVGDPGAVPPTVVEGHNGIVMHPHPFVPASTPGVDSWKQPGRSMCEFFISWACDVVEVNAAGRKTQCGLRGSASRRPGPQRYRKGSANKFTTLARGSQRRLADGLRQGRMRPCAFWNPTGHDMTWAKASQLEARQPGDLVAR